MRINYVFSVGERVCYAYGCRFGEVVGVVPGNGSIEWYYVRWDDGGEDRYVASDLTFV